MTHYQKLATMIFRIIGVFFLFVGILTAVAAFVVSVAWYRQFAALIATSYALPCTIIGIFLFSFGKRLGVWVCFDFDTRGDAKDLNPSDGMSSL